MKFIRVLWSVLIVLFNLHEVADGQAQTNVTGTKVSANVTGTKVPDGQGISNATGTQVSTIVNGTKTPDGTAFTNTTGTQVSTNATGTLVPTNATGTPVPTNATGTPVPTNATGTLVPTNATGTQVFTNATATLVPTNTTGTLVPTNATGNQVSTNASGTQVSANTTGTKVSDGQAHANATRTQVSSTQKPASTLLVEGGSWNTGTYKKPNWLWKDLHFVVTIKEPESGDPLHKTLDFAIGFWAYSTCIEFILTKDEKTDLVFKRGRECSVDYGTPGTPSIIHVNDSCSSLRHVHHFLGHYMGLFDEQRRPDRDEYIEILQKDLLPATQKLMSKFDRSEVNLYSTMYDLSSVMHMSPRSVDDGDKAIFRTKNPKFRGIPGRVVHPSHRDYYRVSAIHGCQEKFQKRCQVAPNSCKNGGILTHFCACECPPGTNGTHCEHVTGHYYELLETTCNQLVTKNKTTVMADNFLKKPFKTSWCLFQVKAPEHHLIIVTFDFAESNETIKESARCQGSLLSITEVSLQEVNEFVICGEDFQKLHIYISTTNEVDIYYDVTDTSVPRGFKATITFHDEHEDHNVTAIPTSENETTTDPDSGTFFTYMGDDEDSTTLPSPTKKRTSTVSTTGKTTASSAHTEASHRATTTAGNAAGLPVRARCSRDVFLCIFQYVVYPLIVVHLLHL